MRVNNRKEKEINTSENSKAKSSTDKVLIHNILLVDCSGSMSGSKIKAANEAIQSELSTPNPEGVIVHNTVLGFTTTSFSHNKSTYSVIEHKHQPKSTRLEMVKYMDLLEYDSDVNYHDVILHATGGTPLYDALAEVMLSDNNPGNKYLQIKLKVYTDGKDMHSSNYNSTSIKRVIEDFTANGNLISFIGTEQDVNTMVRSGIERSNTLGYDGTGQGLRKSLASTRSADKKFYAAVAEYKVPVTEGFFKDVV